MLRIVEDPDLRAGLATTGVGAMAEPVATTAAPTGIGSGAAGWNVIAGRAGSNAGSAGTGSVGDASAEGFTGSLGVVMGCLLTRSAAR